MKAEEPIRSKSLTDQVMLAQTDKKHKVQDSMNMKAEEPTKSQSLTDQVMLA